MARFLRGQTVLVGGTPYRVDRAVVTDPEVDELGRIVARSYGRHIVPMEDVCRPVEDVRPGTNAWALMQLREAE